MSVTSDLVIHRYNRIWCIFTLPGTIITRDKLISITAIIMNLQINLASSLEF